MIDIYKYPTKSEYGFTDKEIKELLTLFPNINMEKFNDALMGNTCMIIDNEIITYHCDIDKAIRCGVENRNLTQAEWD